MWIERLPEHSAGQKARMPGVVLDHVIRRGASQHHKEVIGQLQRTASRALLAIDQREDAVGPIGARAIMTPDE